MAEPRSYWDRFLQRRASRSRVLRGAALGGAGLAAAAVIGCREERRPAAPGAPEAREPKRGGTLIGFDDGDLASFDIYVNWAYRTMMYASMTYPRLYKFKVGPDVGPAQWEAVPDLAERLEQPDNLTYVFKLLPATWEDKPPTNGRKLTAQEVAFNWERLTRIHPNRPVVKDVERVETPDESTVVFKLSAPLGSFISHISHHGMFYIYARELIEADKTRTEQVSAGPFILDGNYEVGKGATYKRNPKYYRGPNVPYIDAFQFRIIPDASARLAALRAKQVDTVMWVGVTQIDEPSLRRDLPRATFIPYNIVHDSIMTLDGNNRIFLDERVRRAISMTLDRDALLRISGGRGLWSTPIGTLPKWYLDPKDRAKFGESAKWYHRDLAEAKRLLAAAGYPDGIKGLPFSSTVPWLYPTRKSEWELAHAQLKEGGIDTELRVMEFAAFYAIGVLKADHEGLAWTARLTLADPNEILRLAWDPGAPRAISRGALFEQIERDTQLQGLMEKQRRELREEERIKIIHDLQRYLADKMYVIPYVNVGLWFVSQDYVKDMFWNYSYAPGTEYLERVWLDKG